MFLKLKALSAGTELHDKLSANFNSYDKIFKKKLSGKQKYNTMPTNFIRISHVFPAFSTLNGENIKENNWPVLVQKFQMASNTLLPKNFFHFEKKGSIFLWFSMYQLYWCGKNSWTICIKEQLWSWSYFCSFPEKNIRDCYVAINSYHQPILLYEDLIPWLAVFSPGYSFFLITGSCVSEPLVCQNPCNLKIFLEWGNPLKKWPNFKQKIGHRLPYINYLYKGLHDMGTKNIC